MLCYNCYGTGYDPTCPKCGYVHDEYELPYALGDGVCYECQERIEFKFCELCEGTGTVWDEESRQSEQDELEYEYRKDHYLI